MLVLRKFSICLASASPASALVSFKIVFLFFKRKLDAALCDGAHFKSA
jgi:hypothetical protein